MTSDEAGVPRAAGAPTTERAFVWTWLPGAKDPVVAGRLDRQNGGVVTFTYGRSYLGRSDGIALYIPELPLRRGPIPPVVGEIASCIADAGPDGWGRRVILNRRVGADAVDTEELDELTYLLESGSDRIGALDFASSSQVWVPRFSDHGTLEELAQSAQRVEDGVPLSPALDAALLHGSSVGGARPKALTASGRASPTPSRPCVSCSPASRSASSRETPMTMRAITRRFGTARC